MEVLCVCGYDPEEVISASVRVEEPCDSDTDSSYYPWELASTAAPDYPSIDNDSTSDEEGESDVSADDVSDSTSNQEWESDVSAEDVIARQPDAVTPHHHESLLLEGDAEVWSS